MKADDSRAGSRKTTANAGSPCSPRMRSAIEAIMAPGWRTPCHGNADNPGRGRSVQPALRSAGDRAGPGRRREGQAASAQQVEQRFGRLGPGEEEALAEVAAQLAEAAAWSAVSMPSATSDRPRAWASSITARTMAWAWLVSAPVPSPSTKDRSILRTSTGNRRR